MKEIDPQISQDCSWTDIRQRHCQLKFFLQHITSSHVTCLPLKFILEAKS